MGAHYFMQAMMLVAGLVSVVASIMDASWFFESRTVRRWSSNAERGRARLYYGALGTLMIIMAVYAFYKTHGF